MTLNRREALVFAASAGAISLSSISPSLAAEGEFVDMNKFMAPMPVPDRPIGSADAKLTIVEYASPTCPHCVSFHVNVFPQVKKEYVDTGKVRYILRPFLRNALDAAVFMLAGSADADAYHTIVDTYFETHSQWALSDRPRDALLKIALQLGFTEESFEAALTNQELFSGMDKMRTQALEEFDLTGTPTFYLNGKQLSGDKNFDELAKEIDSMLG